MTGIGWLWVLIGYNTEWFIAVHLPRLQCAKRTSLYFGSLVILQRQFCFVIMEIASLNLSLSLTHAQKKKGERERKEKKKGKKRKEKVSENTN